ncbi:unnamed protein product [Paramecium primaurelia]|uniref:RNA helicase n=1 Tax=Paramecium primaurelia TaxID=5886 RepID=A0A8S1LSS7_PARPR|nr:unnamed protein product [Paramecium primaurelia]
MSRYNQNENPVYDEFDPDNLDMDDIVKRRWKAKSGKVVGFKNDKLPFFQKTFLDPKKLGSQPISDKIREFLKEKEIAIKSLDGQPCPFPFLTWESTQFPPQIQNIIDELKFRNPTPIQSVVFPLILSGYDVIGVAETGSGKTFGYLLPGLIQIKCQKYDSNYRDRINGPEILILAPTRELVMQIKQQVELFMKPNNLTVAMAYGGQNRDQQAAQIRRNPDILVACPGRLRDFLQEGILVLSKVTYLVIDEADRLLDMGFEDDVRYIVEQTRQDRQTVFFSATWPKAVRNLSLDFCAEDPIYVQVGRSNLTINKNIDQEVICLYNNQKLQTLLDILDQLKINDKVLIFAETRISCEQLSVDMTNEGYYAVALHGNKTQQQRDSIMALYKQGETKLLCATDLASRGLDVSDITVVVNYDFPKYFDDYIHRIGRTGRAGRKGRAISFFSIGKDQPQMARELLKFNQIHKLKLNEQLMQDLANGIKLERNNNFNGITKYNGQIMTHQNNSKFTVPNLTKEEQAKFYMQPQQYENVQNKNRSNNYGRQDQFRPNRGQYHNNKQHTSEEQFYQDRYQQNNQQRRQFQPFQNQNRVDDQNRFQGQRREDYLNSGRDNVRSNQQPRFGNQQAGSQRNDQPWPNNQYQNFGRQQDNRRDEYRGEKNDFQNRQAPYQQQGYPPQQQQGYPQQQQQGYPPQNKDQWNSNQRDQLSNSRNQQFQQNTYDNEKRGQPNNASRNQYNNHKNYQNNPFVNDQDGNQRSHNQEQRGYQNQFSYGQGRGYQDTRVDEQFDNQRNKNPNYRSYDNQDNNRNRQGIQSYEQNQQQMKTNPNDNYRDRNQDQNQQNYPQNRRINNDYNNNYRENNTRQFVDLNKPQDDSQYIRKDSSQQLGPNTQQNFNNLKPNEEQIQLRENVQAIQPNLDYQGRSQNLRQKDERVNEGYIKNQEINPKIIPQQLQGDLQGSQFPPTNRINDNFQPNFNNYIPQAALEQQQFNQPFAQRQDQNHFINERFQSQQQGVDRQYNQNQRSLLDQKTDQMINSQDNQIQYDNNRQRQYQDNFRPFQQDVQSFQRNERVLPEQDDNENQLDFTQYSREVENSQKRFELEQVPKTNQQELRNSRKNSDQQERQDLEQNADSQIQY